MGNIIDPLLEDLEAFLQLSKEEVGRLILKELISYEENRTTKAYRVTSLQLAIQNYKIIN